MLRCVGSGLSIWEMTEICVELPKNMENDLDMWITV